MRTYIDDKASVHTLLNTFAVHPERQAEVVDCLRAFTEQNASKLPGFIAAAVHASTDGRTVVNYVQWQTAAHLHAMLASAKAKQHLAELALLVRSIRPVDYTVAYVGTRTTHRD